VLLQCALKQIMGDVVEQAFNIKLKNPVIFPAPLPGYPDSIQRRFPGPVAVRVWKEDRLELVLSQ
jgi:hypothetical protein